MGRPRIPTAIHKARGNPGRRPLPAHEPKPGLAVVERERAWPLGKNTDPHVHVVAHEGQTLCSRAIGATWARGTRPPVDWRKCAKCEQRLGEVGDPAVPPSWLSEVGAEAWKRLVPQLVSMRVLTEPDRLALEMLCEVYAEYRAHRDDQVRNGLTHVTEGRDGNVMLRSRPSVGAGADASRRTLLFAREFGLTPASRARVVALPLDEKEDTFSKKFAGGA